MLKSCEILWNQPWLGLKSLWGLCRWTTSWSRGRPWRSSWPSSRRLLWLVSVATPTLVDAQQAFFLIYYYLSWQVFPMSSKFTLTIFILFKAEFQLSFSYFNVFYLLRFFFFHFNKNELSSKNVCLLLSVRENFKRESAKQSATVLFENWSGTSSIDDVISTTTALWWRHQPSTGGLAPPLRSPFCPQTDQIRSLLVPFGCAGTPLRRRKWFRFRPKGWKRQSSPQVLLRYFLIPVQNYFLLRMNRFIIADTDFKGETKRLLLLK